MGRAAFADSGLDDNTEASERAGERLLTARELGSMLGFSAATIVDWSERGEVPAFRLGGRLRFRPSEIALWLEGRRARP